MRLTAAVISVVLPVVIAACSDSIGPEDPFSISVTLESLSSPSFLDGDSATVIQCVVTFRAVAEGSGSGTWADAFFYAYAGPDRSVAVDSSIIPASEVKTSWNAPSIQASTPEQAQWTLSASVPFEAGFVYRYTKGGEVHRTAPVRFPCGPAIPAGTPPPTLNQAAVLPAGGDLEYGDTLHLSLSASSTVGMWESDVDITGACNLSQRFPEHLSTTVSHTVAIPIPPACQYGGTLAVKVSIFDASLRGVEAPLGTFTLHDHKPPEYNFTFGWLVSSLAGSYVFAGDTVHLRIGAADNYALGKAFWEFVPQGLRDSLQMHSTSWDQEVSVPIPSSWSGNTRVRAYVRDSIGNTSDTLVTPSDSLRVVPLATHAVRESAVIPDFRSLTIDEPRGRVYAIPYNLHEILGISMQSASISDTIVLPSNGGDIDATASGDTLVVGLPGQHAVGIVDLTVAPPALTVVPLTSIADSVFPELVRVAANGKAFVTVNGGQPSQRVLVEVDLATRTDRVRTDAGISGVVGYAPMERSLDHTRLIVNGIYGFQSYSSGSDAFGPGHIVNVPLYQPKLNADGSRILIGTGLYDASLNLLRRFETPSQYESVAGVLTPDGATVYQSFWPVGIIRNDAATGTFIDRTRIPFQSLALWLSSDGKTLVLFDNQFSKIALMDLP